MFLTTQSVRFAAPQLNEFRTTKTATSFQVLGLMIGLTTKLLNRSELGMVCKSSRTQSTQDAGTTTQAQQRRGSSEPQARFNGYEEVRIQHSLLQRGTQGSNGNAGRITVKFPVLEERLVSVGHVYWITGLSGAGKSTLGRLLYQHLRARKEAVVLLDGDILRETFGNDLGHDRADRLKSAMRNARLCKLLSDQGIDVVCATISLFHDCQEWNRSNIPGYREIFLDAPIPVLSARDQKGVYKQQTETQTEVVGVNIKEERPFNPDVVLVNDGEKTVEHVFAELVQKLQL